jgi:hypothetical protein
MVRIGKPEDVAAVAFLSPRRLPSSPAKSSCLRWPEHLIGTDVSEEQNNATALEAATGRIQLGRFRPR